MKINLTDSEWIQLIDGGSKDSQLQKCCGNISELRDEIVQIVRDGRHDDIDLWLSSLKRKLGWVYDGGGHGEPTPVIQKIMDQIGFVPSKEVHK